MILTSAGSSDDQTQKAVDPVSMAGQTHCIGVPIAIGTVYLRKVFYISLGALNNRLLDGKVGSERHSYNPQSGAKSNCTLGMVTLAICIELLPAIATLLLLQSQSLSALRRELVDRCRRS